MCRAFLAGRGGRDCTTVLVTGTQYLIKQLHRGKSYFVSWFWGAGVEEGITGWKEGSGGTGFYPWWPDVRRVVSSWQRSGMRRVGLEADQALTSMFCFQ